MNDIQLLTKAFIKNLEKGVPTEVVLKKFKAGLKNTSLEKKFPDLKVKVLQELKKRGNFETVVIETPYQIDDKITETILRSLNISSVKTSVVINESLIAGFKVTHKGKVYEASAKQEYKKILEKYI